jgi:hypothetical protein
MTAPNTPNKRATNFDAFVSNAKASTLELEEGYQNIRSKIEAIEENFGRLDKALHEAINRSRPFLVNDPRDTNSAGSGPVPTPPMSPHAHTLDSLNDKIWDLGTLVKAFASSIDS